MPTLPNPIRLSRTELNEVAAPPGLGEDTVSVLTDLLSLGEDEIERLRAEGIVASTFDSSLVDDE